MVVATEIETTLKQKGSVTRHANVSCILLLSVSSLSVLAENRQSLSRLF